LTRPVLSLWRWVLGAAAAYNLIVAVPGLLAAETALSDRIVALLIGCFGLVYALVAWQPLRLAPVLWAGVIGKIGVVALMLPTVLAGTAIPGTGAILAGDAVFTALFLLFLLGPRRLTGR
jgi:hypothetical protein